MWIGSVISWSLFMILCKDVLFLPGLNQIPSLFYVTFTLLKFAIRITFFGNSDEVSEVSPVCLVCIRVISLLFDSLVKVVFRIY